MTQVGLLPSQELVSLYQNEANEWLDVPDKQTVVPLVKLDKPAPVEGKKWEPVLNWFNDRVDRDWKQEEADPLTPVEQLALARAKMASILDGLPLPAQSSLWNTRLATEQAFDRGRIDIARQIVASTIVPPELEATKTSILALFP